MTKQGAAKLVRTLEDAGYLERRPFPGDSRAQLLLLTRNGKRVLRLAAAAQRRFEQRLVKLVGADDGTAMRRALAALIEEDNGAPALRPVW